MRSMVLQQQSQQSKMDNLKWSVQTPSRWQMPNKNLSSNNRPSRRANSHKRWSSRRRHIVCCISSSTKETKFYAILTYRHTKFRGSVFLKPWIIITQRNQRDQHLTRRVKKLWRKRVAKTLIPTNTKQRDKEDECEEDHSQFNHKWLTSRRHFLSTPPSSSLR